MQGRHGAAEHCAEGKVRHLHVQNKDRQEQEGQKGGKHSQSE
jgi:hypothetical protein